MKSQKNPKRFFTYGYVNELLNKHAEKISTDDESKGKLISGMSLDCARRYYPVQTIKQLIDTLAGNHHSFLQLHLSDDQNVGVECALLGQTVKTSELLSDGSYRNPHTMKQFLSAAQIKDIIQYARERNVDIIPEIDAPAHMEGFFTLAEAVYGSDYVNTLAYSRRDYPGELNISSPKAIHFVEQLYDEYASLFNTNRYFNTGRYFHIGCDEHFSGSAADKISYIMRISSYMKDKGFRVRMWNDLLTKSDIYKLDKSIQVTYWSWDGDAQDENVRAARQEERATVADLQAEGLDILIYNSYYLYYVPSHRNFNQHDMDYTVNDLRENWTVRNWYKNSGLSLESLEHIIGSAVSLWSEDSGGLPTDKIIAQFIRHYRAMEWVNNREEIE
ncbi:MAG: family 20 glycosylhydrolase [Erysipelotrichaceae bacterium]|nr:family 20 glycosylhydrolase [Erysipelotrichaceae bacterium]